MNRVVKTMKSSSSRISLSSGIDLQQMLLCFWAEEGRSEWVLSGSGRLDINCPSAASAYLEKSDRDSSSARVTQLQAIRKTGLQIRISERNGLSYLKI